MRMGSGASLCSRRSPYGATPHSNPIHLTARAKRLTQTDTGTSPRTARMCRPYKYKPHARDPTNTGSRNN